MLRISVDSQYLVNCKDMSDGVPEKVMGLLEKSKCWGCY